MRVRSLPTERLSPEEVAAIRDLQDAAWAREFEDFDDTDWSHATGGIHFVIRQGEEILAHASVVERELHADGHPLRTGYVEAVATRPEQQGRGHGTAIMREVTAHIDRSFDFGALSSRRLAFYGRLGWRPWRGPTFVRTGSGPVRTADEDGYVLVHSTPTTPELDTAGPITCDWRPGDAW